jgi:CarD family transcriptional regulator
VGECVVYPHHGAAIIEAEETVTVGGRERIYLVLRTAHEDLLLKVPADNTAQVGIRDVIGEEEVRRVFEVLTEEDVKTPANWSRRFKIHGEKLRSGDIYQVAEVVRNLSLRNSVRTVSAGEKRMLAKARQILVSELVFAMGLTQEEAERTLDEHLAHP